MSLKLTDIRMDWSDTGATVSYTSSMGGVPFILCPRCAAAVESGVTHLCGDRIPKVKAKRQPKKRKATA